MAEKNDARSATSADSIWLERIRRNPDETALRLDYAEDLRRRGDPRAELIRIEEEMRLLSRTSDEWWARREKRNLLRDETDVYWRDELDYGTRQDGSALNQWPVETADRWRIIRAFAEEWAGARVGDIGQTCDKLEELTAARGPIGLALREWICFVDTLRQTRDWQFLFRDAISLYFIGKTKNFSLMIQGEADYHWAVALKEFSWEDPPVTGFPLDYDTNKFVRDRKLATDMPYGSYRRLTDYVRKLLKTYAGSHIPHPRLRTFIRH